MFATYQPSGRFGLKAIPLLLVGVVVAIVIAFVYKFLLDWIPLIYVNFLMTFGVGIAFGFVGALVVSVGHVRNVMLAFLIGALLTIGGLGAKFFFQYTSSKAEFRTRLAEIIEQDGQIVEMNQEDFDQFVEKEYPFSKHISTRVERGWSIGRGGNGAPINGIFVYLIWLIELGIVGVTAIAMTASSAREPYSEELGAWASEEEIVMTLPITSPEMVTQIRSATTVDELLAIPIPKTDESNQFAMYKVNSIEGADTENAYLSVELMTLSINSDGEQEAKKEELVKHAILTSEQRAILVENADLMNEAFAEYRAAVEAEQDADSAAEDGPSESGSDGSQT